MQKTHIFCPNFPPKIDTVAEFFPSNTGFFKTMVEESSRDLATVTFPPIMKTLTAMHAKQTDYRYRYSCILHPQHFRT